jgi:hypothetical protein
MVRGLGAHFGDGAMKISVKGETTLVRAQGGSLVLFFVGLLLLAPLIDIKGGF